MTDLNLRRQLSIETDQDTGVIRVREARRYDPITLTIVFVVVFVWVLVTIHSMIWEKGHHDRLAYLISAIPATAAAYGMYVVSLRRNPNRDVETDTLGPQAFSEAAEIAESGTPADKDETARLVLTALGLPARPEDYKNPLRPGEDEAQEDTDETASA